MSTTNSTGLTAAQFHEKCVKDAADRKANPEKYLPKPPPVSKARARILAAQSGRSVDYYQTSETKVDGDGFKPQDLSWLKNAAPWDGRYNG
jgi:hypothetical protein